ncbi:MAG: class I SAM-dependent methyltransferase [Nanoarchaeota archaeon]|nr:class I SAM-dependent methyltransferase [Nanoarchaeota archaeon]MBU1643633.1 class I SAM-dependent methyltransferase [Nanoarchaeota archaeon]MBU1977147.1 class I SAM-dependent methyltransferase [Nanoarchaeota archaeon]
MKKDPLWYRIRGLDTMEERFGDYPIQKFLKKRTQIEDLVRVMELGFGEGRCLLELRTLFPELEYYGINNKKEGNMHARSDFNKNAQRFGLSIPNKNMPKPFFYDAGEGLHFDSNSLDLIMSQVAFHYISEKAKIIEEVWRVLKPGGKAFLHIDAVPKENYPDFMKSNPETPRFVIYDGDKMVKLSTYLGKIKKSGHDLKFRNASNNKDQRVLLLTKNTGEKLDLGLRFDGISTLNLAQIKGLDSYKTESGVWWGTRSVYYLK